MAKLREIISEEPDFKPSASQLNVEAINEIRPVIMNENNELSFGNEQKFKSALIIPAEPEPENHTVIE